MHAAAVFRKLAGEAERAEGLNRSDSALRPDSELCAHDWASRLEVFDAPASERPARNPRMPKATKRKATGARVWWKDYVCPKKVGQPVKRKCTPAMATVKRVRK